MALYDLRKSNVTNVDEAIQFLDLIDSRLGQVKKLLKDQKFKNTVLLNRLNAAEANKEKEVVYVDRATNSVVGGANLADDNPESIDRLEQLRQAFSTEDGLPLEEESQIGNINIETDQTKVPTQKEATTAPEVEDPSAVDETPNTLPRDEDVESVGSKVARKTKGNPKGSTKK